jgi:short subunit dehydrogenase-like uncharacterized protein
LTAHIDSRPYSFVILGATGSAGRAAVRYLQPRLRGAVEWAIAGRDRRALEAIANQFPRAGSPAVIECDASDYASVGNLARQTHAIGNLAGPYGRIGDGVVRACVEHATHYIDICGEVDVIAGWVRDHHAAALSRGIKIIVAAGFESLIFDLATRAAVEALGEPDGRPVEVDVLLSLHDLPSMQMDAMFSSGTLATFIDTLERRAPLDVLFDPFCLTPQRPDIAAQMRNRVRLDARYDANREVWCAPLVPGPFLNRAIVHRTNHLLAESGRGYGPEFTYTEALNVSSRAPWPAGQLLAAEAIAAWARGFVGALGNERLREAMLGWLHRYAVPRSDAPLGGLNEAGYQVDVFATRGDADSVSLQIFGHGDPGGRVTANLFGEALLAFGDRQRLPAKFGVLSPAVGLGMDLGSLLRNVGASFDLVE